MPVTTRTYEIANSTPTEVLNALESALFDLNYLETTPWGYLGTFTNSPGSIVPSQVNQRYLTYATTTGIGANAVFDVLRSPTGNILTVTLVTGGENYAFFGAVGNTSGNVLTLSSTTGVYPGQIVTKISGTGTLAANTLVDSVVNATAVTLNQIPSVALSGGANITFQDVLTIPAANIGGSTYSTTVSGSSGSTTLTVNDVSNVVVGQRVIGTNIGPHTVVTAVTNNSVTVSRASLGTVSGSITFSDEILVVPTLIINQQNVSGTVSGATITNVITNSNLYAGAAVDIVSGPSYVQSNTRVYISSVSGSGPYTINLRTVGNDFKGFNNTGSIVVNVSAGSNVKWFARDVITAPQTYAWGVAEVKNANSKKLGITFWMFYVSTATTLGNGTTLSIKPMSGFLPSTQVAQGVNNLDWFLNAGAANTAGSLLRDMPIASSWYANTTLTTRQSGIDSNFATLSFYEGNNNRNPFFISKYNSVTQPWDLNDVFLGGVYEILPNAAYLTNDASLLFRIRLNGVPKRMAEAGYTNYNLATTTTFNTLAYRTHTGNRMQSTPTAGYGDMLLYSRQLGDIQTSLATTIPIYKNIPIYPGYVPTPYYMPEDFVLIEIPWKNPIVRDTVTVSGSEIYTIIQCATNQVTYTGMTFAVRTT